MKFIAMTPELMVDDMVKSLDFYQNELGFTTTVQVPEESKEPFFVVLKKDSIELMLYHRDYFAQEIPSFAKLKLGGSIALYIEVENVQELYELLVGKVTVIQELHQTDYGSTEFSCLDPNGYVLMFSQRG